MLAACTQTPPAVPTPTSPLTCGEVLLPDPAITCLLVADGVLLQTAAAQATFTIATNAQWTLQGTGVLRRDAQAQTLTILALEGTSIVSARGTTRIATAGAQVVLSLDEANTVMNLSNAPQPIDLRVLRDLALVDVKLPRLILTPAPIAPPPDFTPLPSDTPTSTPISLTIIARGTLPPTSPADCVPLAEWTGNYTVATGDVLAHIARDYAVTVEEMQAGNCLPDANRIRVGQTLRVPPIPTVTPYDAPTFTPSAVLFRADRDTVAAGECTVIRWDVFNVSAVFFAEEATTPNNVRQVCPSVTTTYTLRVVYPDGSQTQHEITVSVSP